MSHLQDENPYIVHETTDLFGSILKLFQHRESDPNKVLKMKHEKLAELKIQNKIWYNREKQARSEWNILYRKDHRYYRDRLRLLHNEARTCEKKTLQLKAQYYKLANEIEKLEKKQQVVHNHKHGDSEIYTQPNLEQLKRELQQLKNDLKSQEDQLEDKRVLLKNLKNNGDKQKINSDKKSYEKGIKELKGIIERTKAKIHILARKIKYFHYQ
jgi:DNA repair exonuclease SbcCD ATPase subunit